jgi:hypothetical protein
MSAMLTVPQIAADVHLDAKTVRRAIERGELVAYDFRAPGADRPVYRIEPADLKAWKAARVTRGRRAPADPPREQRPPERGTLRAARARRAAA